MQYQIQAKAWATYIPLRLKELLFGDMTWVRFWVGVNTLLVGISLANSPNLKESIGNFCLVDSPLSVFLWAGCFIASGVVGIFSPFFQMEHTWVRRVEYTGGVILWSTYVAARPPLLEPTGIVLLAFEIWLMALSLGETKK